MPTSSNAPRRTMLLTGASRGIGHATVIRFSSAGWRVITCSRHPFPENCPWDAGPEDHVQVDLSNHADTTRAISDIRERLEGGALHALVNNAAISPKAPGGRRMGTMDTDIDTWSHVFQVNFFAPIMMARGLIEELKAAKGSVVNVTSIAGSRVHPFAGAAYATSKAALASLTREMASAGRDRYLDPVAGHRENRRGRHPAAPARHPRRSREDHLCAVHGNQFIREWRGNPHQRRPARLNKPIACGSDQSAQDLRGDRAQRGVVDPERGRALVFVLAIRHDGAAMPTEPGRDRLRPHGHALLLIARQIDDVTG